MAIKPSMTIRGILFDKDGTLIDFPSTWTPVLKALSLEFAKGDRARAWELMETAGYDPETDRFKPGSIWAAANTALVVPRSTAIREPASRTAEAAASLLLN